MVLSWAEEMRALWEWIRMVSKVAAGLLAWKFSLDSNKVIVVSSSWKGFLIAQQPIPFILGQ